MIRLWELDVDALMGGDIGLLPLAPLAGVSPAELPAVVYRMRDRIEGEASVRDSGALWTATFIMMGLRFPPELTEHVLRGVRQMRESSTYQLIIAEGEAKGEARGRAIEARNLILRLGAQRFGNPDTSVKRAIRSIRSVERLEELADRLLKANDWRELLQ